MLNAVKQKQELQLVRFADNEWKVVGNEIPRPAYRDNLAGLGITVNDTWGYDIIIE